MRINHNDAGKEPFRRATTHWDVNDPSTPPRAKWLLRQVQPGDVIHLVPRAQFKCWVNIVREASIEVEYEVRDEAAGDLQHQQHLAGTRDAEHPPAGLYEPLNYAGRQIRVLEVRPGANDDDDIVALFEYINLADNPLEVGRDIGFHALSYYWGDASEKKVSISVETTRTKYEIGVSGTLYRAIRRLRSSTLVPLRIWIDAVCINQDDPEERAQQVAMMGNIYSRAEVVHVWLDDYVLGLDEALRIVRDIYNVNKRCCPGGFQCQCSGTKHTLSSEQMDDITKATGWHSFGYTREVFSRHREWFNFSAAANEAGGGEGDVHFTYFMQTFFHHPWFQRVWVVQEAILSPKTVVYSANEEIPWEELVMINEMASTPEWAGEARWSAQARDTMPAIWHALTGSHGGNRLQEDQTPLPILEVFLKALDLKATNPRDKLWALLSFGHETKNADRIPHLLRPDYSKPLEDVVADFTRWWILEHNSLDILSFIHCQPARAWRRTLYDDDARLGHKTSDSSTGRQPTWALATEGYAQWTHMTLREQFPSLLIGPSITTNNNSPDLDLIRPSSRSNPLELHLRGNALGKIKALSRPPSEMVGPELLEVEDADGDDKPHKTISAVFNRLFDPSARTGIWLLQGVNYHEEHWDSDVLRDILDAHTFAHYGYVVDPCTEGAEAEAEGLPSCIERCFFVLDNGLYGLCPWTAREGDVVALLRGGGVPYLLRPLSVSKQEEGDGRENFMNREDEKYQLVGECYVDGIRTMAGEDADGSVFVLV